MENPPGVFLIRKSAAGGIVKYALSILDMNERNQRITRHYRVNVNPEGKLFINERLFSNLDELVEHYTSSESFRHTFS
jgi:hypothetical protein